MAAAAHAARNNKHKRREEMKASAREGFKDSRARVRECRIRAEIGQSQVQGRPPARQESSAQAN